MNLNKLILSIASAGLAAVLTLSPSMARATNINFTVVRTIGTFNSLAADPATGYLYDYTYYGVGSETMDVYHTAAALAAGTPSSTVALAGGYYGTYIAANKGILYGRTSTATTSSGTWSLSTGAQLSTSSGFSGMAPTSFNWGGNSGVAFMQDSTGTYVFGNSSANSNDWLLEHLGTGLTPTSTEIYNAGSSSLGYAFVINGELFVGSSYSSNSITHEMNVNTGVVTPISDTLLGLNTTGSYYLSDFTYDQFTNTLYAFDTNTSTLYEATNASTQFGAPSTSSSAVPTPEVLELFAFSLLGLAFLRKKQLLVA